MYVRKIKLGDDVLLVRDSTYEEDSFTPRFYNDSGVEQTFDEVKGYYKKIGNLCYIFIKAVATSDVSVLHIDNLPFPPDPDIYNTVYEKGTVFANGEGCYVNVPRKPGQISLASVSTGNLLVEGIYSISV